jgi:hypothetical protein
LGKFITLDLQTLENSSRKMGRILVEMDIHGGLPEVLDIEWRGRHIYSGWTILEYPFVAVRCHCTGHLRRDCTGKVMEESSEDTLLQKDPP